MAGRARWVYGVFVSWASYNLGDFTIGFSQIGGVDRLATSPGDLHFTGPYDDLSALARRVSWNRGRDSALTSVEAGTATIDVADSKARFNPSNPMSELYNVLSDRLHPVQIIAYDPLFGPHPSIPGETPGFPIPVFTGWVRRLVWEPRGRRGVTQLECVDAFYMLDRAKPVVAATGPTTTGAAIRAILTAIGIVDPFQIDLDVGDSIPGFSADGTKSALELINDLLEPERGVVFVAGSGRITYRARITRLTGPLMATWDQRVQAILPGADADSVENRVTVTRNQTGHVATAVDVDSASRFGYSDLPAIATDYLASDSQADSLAAWLLTQVVAARSPLYGITLENREDDLMRELANREIAQRVNVQVPEYALGGATLSGQFVIERMEHQIDTSNGAHSASYVLSRIPSTSPFVIGTSTIGGTQVFVY